MALQNYSLRVDYPGSNEEILLLKKKLGTEYLKLVKEYLGNLDICASYKREIAEQLINSIKRTYAK